jgi:hypothetical protein
LQELVNVNNNKLIALKQIARNKHLEGYSTMKKSEICNLIINDNIQEREPGNKKDLAVYPGMTTRSRKEMEGDVGNKPSKRYTITHYLPLWTRGEVTISPLGGLRATYHTLMWRQGRSNTFPGSKCVGLSDSTHKDHWIISKEVTPRANPMLSKENVESSIREWEHSWKQAMERYNSICHTGWSTPLLSSTLVHTRLTADRQKTSTEAPSTIEGTEGPPTEEPPNIPPVQLEDRGRTSSRVTDHTPTPAQFQVALCCKLYFAPLLDETAPTTSNFFMAKDENMFLKHAGIKWSKASAWGNALISLPITDKDHLEAFCIYPTVGNQFILVSNIGNSIEDTTFSFSLPSLSPHSPRT